jgi:hypothetical protein
MNKPEISATQPGKNWGRRIKTEGRVAASSDLRLSDSIGLFIKGFLPKALGYHPLRSYAPPNQEVAGKVEFLFRILGELTA